jgi:hypothetical protein
MTDGDNGDGIPLAIAILSRELTAALERLEELEDRLAALSDRRQAASVGSSTGAD